MHLNKWSFLFLFLLVGSYADGRMIPNKGQMADMSSTFATKTYLSIDGTARNKKPIDPANEKPTSMCKIYGGSSGYSVIARVENGKVYSGSSGYTVIARIEGTKIYSGSSGYTVLARVDGQKIYGGSSGYSVIGRIDGMKCYSGSSGYTVAARSEGCGGMSFAAGAAAAAL